MLMYLLGSVADDKKMLKSMNKNPIFLLWYPDPEISYESALKSKVML